MEERERRPASGGQSAARSAAARGEARPQSQWRQTARRCVFCAEDVKRIDYKDAEALSRFLSDRGKIRPRRQTGLCARHQRQLARAVKRARHLALLPFTIDYTHWG